MPIYANPIGAMMQGYKSGQGVQDMRRENALRQLYEQQGAGIAAGDQNALNALAQLDPMAALDVRRVHNADRRADRADQRADTMLNISQERLAMAKEASRREAERLVAEGKAEEVEREAAQVKNIMDNMSQALGRGDMETFTTIRNGLPEEYHGITPGNFAQVATLAGVSLEGMYEAMDSAGPKFSQITGPQAENLGLDPKRVYNVDRNGKITPIGGDGQTFYIGGEQRTAPVSVGDVDMGPQPKGAERAFGVSGLVAGLANTASDFVAGKEVLPEVAEQQRFFRVLEEDLLVDISQAYGRQPASKLMERIRSLAPQVGSVEGAAKALGELQALRRRFSSDLEVAANATPANRGDVAAIQNRVAGLRAAIGRIDAAISRFGSDDMSDDEALMNSLLGE